MYLSFFGLAEKPFSITPDPRYLFLGGRHAEALAHLVYGITESGGFIQLTGEVGTGKTTVIRSLLARQPDNAEIALILNPRMNAAEFVLTICEELGIGVPDSAISSVKELIDILNRYLLRAHAQGRRVVLIVDEAQNLTPELLEQVRLLTNLETDTQKLLQIILIGQPELREMLARNDLRQLAQRITGRYHLDPLSREESAAYVKHRLRIAGATAQIFTNGALSELYRASDGIPRLINVIGDRSLLGGYSEDRHVINAALVRKAAGEVFGRHVAPAWLPWAAGAGIVLTLVATTWLVWSTQMSRGRGAEPPLIATPAPEQPAEDVVAPEQPATVIANLTTLLPASSALTGADTAYARLFGLWGARYTSGGEIACSQALLQGFECLDESGGTEVLRRFNRPAVLPLHDTVGGLHQVVVSRLEPGKAQLLIGDASHEVTLEQLQQHWDGEFLMLWKPAQLDTRTLSPGMQGELVRQLHARLAQWAGIETGTTADVFDDSLYSLVMQFQRRHALAVDGVAGPRTQAMLDSVLPRPDTPLLSAAAP